MAPELRRLQDAVSPVADPPILDELRQHVPTGPDTAADLESGVRQWAEEVAGIADLDPALLEPREAGADDLAWLAYLPTLVQMKLLTQTLAVLNTVLLAAATLGAAAVPLALVLAAEVLIKLAEALMTYVSDDNP